MNKSLVLALTVLGAAMAFAEDEVVHDGKFTVRFVECEKCVMRMRLANDGLNANVNLCRLRDDDPSPSVLAERKAAMAARAFAMLRVADSTKAPEDMRRPLMGWSSWNTFGLNISDELILSVAQAMATNGLAAAGYRYVNIDDGFFTGHGPDGRLIIDARRFPNGLKPVVDGIHALGLKAGIYSDAGADACGGAKGVGLYGHDADDCRLHFNELGFDFIKVDYCGGRKLKLEERTRYTEIANAIRATGRPVRFNICRWAFPGTWAADIAESWRTTGDIRARWSTVRRIIGENLYLGAYAKPGHFNDMDMMEVGLRKGQTATAFGRHDEGLTVVEEEAHFGLWCLFSSPLLIGCDARSVRPETLELVTNPYLLAMNQNDLGLGPYVAHRSGEVYVLVKDADARFGTARYVALYNAEDNERELTLDFATVDLGGEVAVLDLAERADLGVFAGGIALRVPAHGARFLRLDAAQRLERKVYEAESAYLTSYQELSHVSGRETALPSGSKQASGGMIVRWLGARAENDLVWRDVKIDRAGERILEFAVVTYGPRRMSVQIDGGETTVLDVTAADGRLVTVEMKATLAAGLHTVRVFNADAWAPDLDRMTVK